MKNKLIITLFLALFLINNDATSQNIDLNKSSKFIQADNLEFAKTNFDDTSWETKQLGTNWASKDSKPNVYAWHRIKVFMPNSLKNVVEISNGLKLNLGKIDDIDQTYFNGKLIGETGSFPPNYKGEWDKERQYIIPFESILWDSNNVIAIRIFSPDFGGIGMYAGPYNLVPIGWKDFIAVKEIFENIDNKGFTTSINFSKTTNYSFVGNIKYWIKDKTGNELYSETKPIDFSTSTEKLKTITFEKYQSQTEDFFTIGYEITDAKNTITVTKEQFYLSNPAIELPIKTSIKPIVNDRIKSKYISSDFQNIQFKGYLGKRMLQNLNERLLKVDENGLCGSYLSRPGIHPWAGEHIGKYLETACNVWKNTHDNRLKKQMDRIVYKLINSQLKNGYLGTYTPNDYWTSWDVWSHKYNLHGLLAYYKTFGYKPALESSVKMGNLICKTFGNQPSQLDIISAGEHKGMAATSILDAMIELYKYTGEKKYLDFCYYILTAWEQDNGPKIISKLLTTSNVAKVGNGKAYEMISNFVGLIKLYRITADKKLLKPVEIAWQNIVDKKLYLTGTTSSWEYFQEDNVLPATEKDHMGEGCVTTTWLQLNQNLFEITGNLKYYNQAEKIIYNHLLAAENPQTGCVSYYTPLMSSKPFTCYITCCQSSVPRGIGLIPNFVFGKIKNNFTLLNYESANYSEKIKLSKSKFAKFNLIVKSNFPEKNNVEIEIKTNKNVQMPLNFRIPNWSKSFVATINNEVYYGKKNVFLTINRFWKSGEKIKISFKTPLQTIDGGKSYPNQLAFQKGPQVLALDENLNRNVMLGAIKNYNFKNSKFKKINTILPTHWVGNQAFILPITNVNISNQNIILVPFADASQTGGAIRVWLPINKPK